MYKYNGKHRDPGPAKNSRSRREDAEGSSFKATAERPSSSYSHLILGNFDAPHAPLKVISLHRNQCLSAEVQDCHWCAVNEKLHQWCTVQVSVKVHQNDIMLQFYM